MRVNRWIGGVLAIGLISTVVLVYFYSIQRNFTQNHREFLVSISNLENLDSDVTYLVLENSLYAYNNQDPISHTSQELQKEYIKLQNTKILQDKHYIIIKDKISSFKEKFHQNIQNVEDYQMLNAGVKNSLLFLTRHIENRAQNLDEDEFKDVFVESVKILKRFTDAKKMQDEDYIEDSIYLLKSDSRDIEIQKFIKSFNLHSSYLIKNYPTFIAKTKEILNNNIHKEIKDIRDNFSKIALNDFKALDTFATILFSVFIVSLFTIIVLFIKYIRENKKLTITKESLEHSLTYDLLTDLYNRRALESELEKIDSPHLILINVDRFKNINDIYGNDTGNYILKELAKLIYEKVSSEYSSKVYRVGGDEFGVLFSKIPEYKAVKIANMLEYEITEHHFKIKDLTFQVIVSISSNNIYPIIENADMALKIVKKKHTDKVLVYKESLNIKKSVQENMNTIDIIKCAISENRIIPYFQPIVNLQTSKIEKYEALVRLKQKDGTILAPFKFLDISKKTRYYRDITKIMIEKTIESLKEYPNYRFSMNISMIDILDDKIVDLLLESLEKNTSVASRFDIELLESENLQDITKVQEFIKNVKKFGCNILIDDFGSGYSNFAYFSDIDVDIIKIDGSIVKEITVNERKQHMLNSIYEFTKGMQMTNIAEFVETREIALYLKEIGVLYAQGYYFSKPLEKPLDSDDITI